MKPGLFGAFTASFVASVLALVGGGSQKERGGGVSGPQHFHFHLLSTSFLLSGKLAVVPQRLAAC